MEICFCINSVRATLFSLLGKLISSGNLQFWKPRTFSGKFQESSAIEAKIYFFLLSLRFSPFHSAALSFVFLSVFIHRANYALQCVSSVAIVWTFRYQLSGFCGIKRIADSDSWQLAKFKDVKCGMSINKPRDPGWGAKLPGDGLKKAVTLLSHFN